MFHYRIAHILNGDSVVADLRAFAQKLPAFALLVVTVSVNKKVADAQVFDGGLRIVDWFTQDDHRAIGAIRQTQDCRIPGTAQV